MLVAHTAKHIDDIFDLGPQKFGLQLLGNVYFGAVCELNDISKSRLPRQNIKGQRFGKILRWVACRVEADEGAFSKRFVCVWRSRGRV